MSVEFTCDGCKRKGKAIARTTEQNENLFEMPFGWMQKKWNQSYFHACSPECATTVNCGLSVIGKDDAQ